MYFNIVTVVKKIDAQGHRNVPKGESPRVIPPHFSYVMLLECSLRVAFQILGDILESLAHVSAD